MTVKQMNFNDETGQVDIEKSDGKNISYNMANVVTATTSAQGVVFTFGGGEVNPAEKSVVPGSPAGITSAAPGPFILNPRGTGFSGWGYLYHRDPDFWFDTVDLPGLARSAGLTGENQWSSIVVEVADASNETSDMTLYGSEDVIATASVAVNSSSDTIGALTFKLKDLAGRPIILGPHNLPSRYVIRYRAENSVGGRAVVGDARPASAPPYFVQAIGYSMPARGTVTQVAASFQSQTTGTWAFNGSLSPAFALSLAGSASNKVILQPEGHYNLQNWLSRLARILDGQAVTATILGVGDSWMHGNTRFARPIARSLKTKFGDGGPGFLGFTLAFAGAYAGGADDAQASVARSGAWVDDLTNSAKGMDAYSVSSSTVGDSITITLGGTARRAKLHYYAQIGGGDVRWKVGAGAWTTISTAAAAAGMETAAIDFGAEITGTTITIEVLTANVILHGIDLQRDTAGVRIHKLGHSGGQVSNFVGVGEAITLTEVASLAPDLCMICFTTNELVKSVAPSVMAANIETFIRRVRKARPYCDFAIIAPFDNATESTVYPWAGYETALWALARKHRAVFFPTRALIGHWGDANKRGLIQDAVPHPTSAGGHLLSGVLLRDFLSLGL